MKSEKPVVSIVMGSDSDLGQVRHCAKMLEYFGVPYEMIIASAHRSPKLVTRHARNLEKRGIQAAIVAAGGAAHLPGVVASETIIPVIGIPIKSEALSGIDSLYSIVQMPKGIPVATVSIGEPGCANSAILAVEILALKDKSLRKKLSDYKKKLAREVLKKSEKLNKMGYEEYMSQKKKV